MSELAAAWASQGRRNTFDTVVKVTQMQSEGGAAGSLHGVLDSGSLATTFTCSQGLLLMIPNMYIIAGQLSPCVFHVTARALSKHGLSIYAEHTDVMAVRQTGWSMLSSATVQECHDMAAVAHLASLKSSVPFVHFFDGYRVSHELNKIELLGYEEIGSLVPQKELAEFRQRGLSPVNPHARACNTGSDIFFQGTEAVNRFYDKVPSIVQSTMDELGALTGRNYSLFDYAGPAAPRHVIVTMGSSFETVKAAVMEGGRQTEHGCVNVRLFRPWSAAALMAAIPKSVTRVTVLDRTKDAGGLGEPLFVDVAASLHLASETRGRIDVVGGRYGLGSKEFLPSHVTAILHNAELADPKRNFTVGIVDDVTFRNLPIAEHSSTQPFSGSECIFFAMASDGTVSANKNALHLVGDNTDLFVQGHVWNDSKKAGGATISHLRFSPNPISMPFEIVAANFVAVSEPTWLRKFPKAITSRIAKNGLLLLNTHCRDARMLEHVLPVEMQIAIAEKQVEVWAIDARKIAAESGLKSNLINNVMQAAFFQLALKDVLPQALPLLIASVRKTYAKRGEDLMEKIERAIKGAADGLVRIDVVGWSGRVKGGEGMVGEVDELGTINSTNSSTSNFYTSFSSKLSRMEGDDLPVSAMDPHGRFPTGMTVFEKRGIAQTIPIVDMDKCTQCNLCAVICPHAAIRPFLLSPNQVSAAPFDSRVAKGGADVQGFNFRIQVSPLDCTGCEACSWTCPDDALTMTPIAQTAEEGNWDFAIALPERAGRESAKSSPRASQLALPMLEFSGACAGCGETPYAKLVTQLFGERMLIANASGCSGVWGAAAGFSSYTKNSKGEGPAWGRSLYEDAAEYGLGMATAVQSRRASLRDRVKELLAVTSGVGEDLLAVKTNPDISPVLRLSLWRWLNGGHKSAKISQEVSRTIKPLLEAEKGGDAKKISAVLSLSNEFVKTAVFVFGGDGFAYDIGFGGIDHVIASGVDLNIVIFDTEGYANTSGQVSKATPIGAVQKFASDGRRRNKKSLAEMAMSYADVYVGTVAIGANPAQSVKTFLEAEAFPGPSLVLCYSPCIEHKIKYPRGLSRLSEEMTLAVSTGYWPLFRFNPPHFFLDAPKRISLPVTAFTEKEDRFGVLERTHPEAAASLAQQLQEFITKQQQRLVERAAKSGEVGARQGLLEKKVVNIVYATETGNTAELATRLKEMCADRGLGARVLEMTEIESVSELMANNSEPLIVLCSTAGDGAFPGMALSFWKDLQDDLTNQSKKSGAEVSFAVFGLGDSSYSRFNEAGRLLDQRLAELGGRRLCPIGLGNDKDADKFETQFELWAPTLWDSLGAAADGNFVTPKPGPVVINIPSLNESSSSLPFPLVPRRNTFQLEVVKNRRVTPLDYDRSISHITLAETVDSSGDLSYLLGDALSVYPRNGKEEVVEFLTKYGLDPNSAVLISSPEKRFEGLTDFPIPLVELGSQVLDLFGKPNKFFFKQLQQVAGEESGIEGGVFSSISEILLKSPRLSISDLLKVVPSIRPRLYSIASAYAAVSGAVDLLVVQHEWPNAAGVVQSGLCSTFFKDLREGDRILVGVAAGTFHLPPSEAVPMVMAGLGTGMAPFRSFIQQRALTAKKSSSDVLGNLTLFYGCRHQAKDFAFKEELTEFTKAGVITRLAPAFSRDQAEKIYIQQRIVENAAHVYDSLVKQKGYFYLCGQAGHMAAEVEDALLTAFVDGGGLSKDSAQAALATMKSEQRYCTELY